MPRLSWSPDEHTQVILTDDVDMAFTESSVALRPTIKLHADTPEGRSIFNEDDDYLSSVILHEYTRVLHLDRNQGVTGLFSRIFGRAYLPSGFAPRWMTEGYSLYEESNLASGGRTSSALFDMWLREQMLEEEAFQLRYISSYETSWPGESVVRLYGGKFLRYTAARVGDERMRHYFEEYGHPWQPFGNGLQESSQKTFGINWATLHSDWMESLKARFDGQISTIRSAGISNAKQVSFAGGRTDTPRYSPDGSRIYYSTRGKHGRFALHSMRTDGTDDRLELDLWQPVEFDISPDGSVIVFAALEWFNQSYTVEDLYLFDLKARTKMRMTRGLRGGQPSFHPDSKRVAFVGRAGSGHTYIGEIHLPTQKTTILYAPSSGQRVFSPVYSPDGKNLYFTQQEGRVQELRRMELATKAVDPIGPTNWMALEPFVAKDGSIYVSSNRSGAYNIHRIDENSGSMTQLTNVDTGAFRPALSPDGKQLAFSLYGPGGFNIATIKPEEYFSGVLPPVEMPPVKRVITEDLREAFPVHEYSAAKTLLPKYWTPVIVRDPIGTVFGASVSGTDLIGRYKYRLDGAWGPASGKFSFSAAAATYKLNPPLSLGVSSDIAQIAGAPLGAFDRRWTATATTSRKLWQRAGALQAILTGGAQLRQYVPDFGQAQIDEGTTYRPVSRGRTLEGFFSITGSTLRQGVEAIGPEEGGEVSLTVRSATFSKLGFMHSWKLEPRGNIYFSMPWLRHHVVALRGSMGFGSGDLGGRRLYSLGGQSIQDPSTRQLDGLESDFDILRGYPPGFLGGDAFALGTAEYRFPLSAANRVFSNIPLFVQRLNVAFFSDIGMVSTRGLQFQRPKTNAGMEIRFKSGETLIRGGYAHGLNSGGGPSVYITLGQPF